MKPRLVPPSEAAAAPVRYSRMLAETICARLSEGETLRAICRDPALPRESVVRRWALEDRGGFAALYARAREIGAYAVADEMLEIADDASADWKDGRAGPVLDREHLQRARLRVETKKWLISKILPHVFGDKTGLEHHVLDPDELSDAELAEIAASGSRARGRDPAEAEEDEE